jgi:hypothetical protein
LVKKQPVLITDAALSQADELRGRQRRYVTMMVTRAGCLVLGAVLISVQAPLLPLWLGLCVLGMILLPWAAVLIANDRSPKKKPARPGPVAAKPQRAITPETPDDREHRTIDVEP